MKAVGGPNQNCFKAPLQNLDFFSPVQRSKWLAFQPNVSQTMVEWNLFDKIWPAFQEKRMTPQQGLQLAGAEGAIDTTR